MMAPMTAGGFLSVAMAARSARRAASRPGWGVFIMAGLPIALPIAEADGREDVSSKLRVTTLPGESVEQYMARAADALLSIGGIGAHGLLDDLRWAVETWPVVESAEGGA